MKTRKILSTLTIMALAIVGAVFLSGFTWAETHNFLAVLTTHPEGLMLGMAGTIPGTMGSGRPLAGNIVTTETATAESPNLLRPAISDQITKIMPASVPLDTLIRKLGAHQKTDGLMFKFYSSELRGFEDTLASAFNNTNTTPPSDGEYDIVVTTPSIWLVDDGILFHNIIGSDGQELVAHVVKKASATLTVIFLNGWGEEGTLAPRGIVTGTKIGRLGNAKSELDAQTSPYGHVPLDAYNYVQAHMAQVEESFWQKAHAKEVNWDIRDMQVMNLYDFRCQSEGAGFFGVRRKAYDSERSVYKYFSGGAIRFINNHLDYDASAMTTSAQGNAWFNSVTKNIFTGNAGSTTRYMFAGSAFMEMLGNIEYVQKQVDGKSTEEMFGITFNKIQTNFGIILILHHQMFNYYGYGDKAIVLDLNNVRKRVFEPMKTRKIDLMSSGIRKANAHVIEETFGLEFRYPDTHAIIKPASTNTTTVHQGVIQHGEGAGGAPTA